MIIHVLTANSCKKLNRSSGPAKGGSYVCKTVIAIFITNIAAKFITAGTEGLSHHTGVGTAHMSTVTTGFY